VREAAPLLASRASRNAAHATPPPRSVRKICQRNLPRLRLLP
jgi:hypothetical protein